MSAGKDLPTYPILAAPVVRSRRSPVNERKSRQECGRARAPRTLWRARRRAGTASTYVEEESLSPSLTCRSLVGGPCALLVLLSPPFHSFVPSCLASSERNAPNLKHLRNDSRAVDRILRRKDTSLSCQFTSIRKFYFD